MKTRNGATIKCDGTNHISYSESWNKQIPSSKDVWPCDCKPKSTPTPWKVIEVPSIDFQGKKSGQATIVDSKGNSIAVVGQNSEVDAKLIVQAVNCHKELVATVKNVLNNFDGTQTLSRARLAAIIAQVEAQ